MQTINMQYPWEFLSEGDIVEGRGMGDGVWGTGFGERGLANGEWGRDGFGDGTVQYGYGYGYGDGYGD